MSFLGGVPGEWTKESLCSQVDPEIWFPEKGGNATGAKKLCQQCPVRIACLTWALDQDERHGIWGGLSERECYKLLQQRRRVAA